MRVLTSGHHVLHSVVQRNFRRLCDFLTWILANSVTREDFGELIATSNAASAVSSAVRILSAASTFERLFGGGSVAVDVGFACCEASLPAASGKAVEPAANPTHN